MYRVVEYTYGSGDILYAIEVSKTHEGIVFWEPYRPFLPDINKDDAVKQCIALNLEYYKKAIINKKVVWE